MKNFWSLCGLVLFCASPPAMAEFEDLQLLPPPSATREAVQDLAPECVENPVVGPERGKIVVDNHEALRARVVMIERANCEILIEYYTVASDRISVAGLALLVEAANRGVKVKILLDDITHQVKAALAAATLYNPRARQNIEIRVFNPFVLLFPRTWLARPQPRRSLPQVTAQPDELSPNRVVHPELIRYSGRDRSQPAGPRQTRPEFRTCSR